MLLMDNILDFIKNNPFFKIQDTIIDNFGQIGLCEQ